MQDAISVALEARSDRVGRFVTLPIFSSAFGAWGFDAWAKQIIPASKAS